MRAFIPLIVSIIGLAVASLDVRGGCSHDNCLRAVAATNHGPGQLSTASSDCSKFLQTTITPPPTTIVVTTTTTQTPISFPGGIEKRAVANTTIPAYAVACTNAARYSSACSCLGVTPFTTTAPTPTVTSTQTVTATPTCTANLLSDPKNCGACGNVCPPGSICQNGSCSTAQCDGSTCQAGFRNCGKNGGCFCFTGANGKGFCGQNAACDLVVACASDEECGKGSGDICAIKTCCPSKTEGKPGICLSPVCENPSMRLVRMAKVKRYEESAAGM